MKIFILGVETLDKFIVEIIESRDDIEIGGFSDDGCPHLQYIHGYHIIGK